LIRVWELAKIAGAANKKFCFQPIRNKRTDLAKVLDPNRPATTLYSPLRQNFVAIVARASNQFKSLLLL
jgi:hypothetical protein